MTPREKAKDKRLQKNYGISLWHWGMIYGIQDGRCAICGRPLNSKANVDHEHFKITASRTPNPEMFSLKWRAETTIRGETIVGYATTKTVAIENARKIALPRSVRGLLCPGRHGKAGRGCCNRLLGRVDNIEWLEKAAAYLKNPPTRSLFP